ncbi:27547_t:CDS:2 [Racocetra persica]|uniref:27547_t:CDS:1 n=1 Tax=Racocetra persica TaxID=160502 RepID=A0ACA9KTB9_9GLOM|nr:27547_t:CDS:2 [Racocetra persica]
MTPDHKEFLYALCDLSYVSYTADLLFDEIEKILIKIGSEKFIRVISDNASTIAAARRQINQKYLPLSIFIVFHLARSYLKKYIDELNISGGGLKIFIETRWISVYKTVNSVFRLKLALEKILNDHPNAITNQDIQIILKSREFFHDGENDKSEDYEDENNKESNDDLVISNHQVVVLIINNVVDLHHQVFNQVGDLYVSNEDNNNSDVAMNEDYEFNLEELSNVVW